MNLTNFIQRSLDEDPDLRKEYKILNNKSKQTKRSKK